MNISATNYFYTEVKLCGGFFAALNLLNLINVALSIKKTVVLVQQMINIFENQNGPGNWTVVLEKMPTFLNIHGFIDCHYLLFF